MSKWLTKFKEERPTKNYDSERDKAYQLIMTRLEYNRLLEREKNAEAWLDSPERTDAEVEKWLPLFNEIVTELNRIINKIGLENCTKEERLFGFNVVLGKEVNEEELPVEWRGVS